MVASAVWAMTFPTPESKATTTIACSSTARAIVGGVIISAKRPGKLSLRQDSGLALVAEPIEKAR